MPRESNSRDFAVQLSACATKLDVTAVLSQALRLFAVTAYALGYVPGQEAASAEPFLLLTWPRAWLELYAREGFAHEDAVVAAAANATAPFTWRELQARQPGASARIFAAAATFGWIDGLLVPIQSPVLSGRLGVASLAMTTVVSDDPSERQRLASLSTLAFERAVELSRQDQAVSLSAREREVMGLVALGRSDREIAAALGVAVPTARFHVEQAKRKLGAKTRSQAVALGFARGLVG